MSGQFVEIPEWRRAKIYDLIIRTGAHPNWSRASLDRLYAKLPDSTPLADLETRLILCANDPGARTPSDLAANWDRYAPAPPPAQPGETDDKRFIPGTRIRRDDPHPGDRDPVTGRTDPAKQSARIARLMGHGHPEPDEPAGAAVPQPPPPGWTSWEAAGRALLTGQMTGPERHAVAKYSRGLPR